MTVDPNIRSKILREAGKRKDKRLRIRLSEQEYVQLMEWSIQEDLSMSELVRKKVFKEAL